MALYVLSGWFLGVQNAVFVLYITLIENLANIAFNLLFIFVFGMRVDGVALGTVCAQYLALSVALVLLFSSYRNHIQKHRLKVILKIRDLMSFFKVNANIMIRTLALMFAFAFFTVRSSSFDDVLLASNMILMQFMIFFAYVVDGLAHAGESLSGLFYGARKHKTLKLLIKRLFIWSFGLAVVFSLLYFSLFRQMLGLLTDQPIVIQSADNFKWWLVVIPLLSFAAFVWDGVYIGMTATAALRNAMLLALLTVYFPAYFLSVGFLGNHALWLAMSLFMLSRGLFLWIFSPSLFKMREK
jgi:multidrug resistance protein, MATE family